MDDHTDDDVEVSVVDLRVLAATDPNILDLFRGADRLAAIERERIRVKQHDPNAPTHSRKHFP